MLLGFRRLCHIELSKQLRDALARWFAECRVIEVLQLATEAQPKGCIQRRKARFLLPRIVNPGFVGHPVLQPCHLSAQEMERINWQASPYSQVRVPRLRGC